MRPGTLRQAFFMLSLIALPLGCSHVISPEMRQAAHDTPLTEVMRNPSAYMGETVVWGGIIVGNVSRPAGAHLVVLEKPLSVQGRPTGETPRGRFIARAPGTWDRDAYANGREITLAGKIVGFEGKPPGLTEPVVMITESHLWPAGDHPPGDASPWWWRADSGASVNRHDAPFRYSDFYYSN